MFIRKKKIKDKEYAYLVENEWKKKPKQKVKAYLGRVHKPDLINEISFLEFINSSIEELMSKEAAEIFKDLLRWEIHKHAITEFRIDAYSFNVTKENKKAVIMINDGFLCGITLRNLFEFRPVGHESDTSRLARCLIEAGIKVPQEVFIGLCEKLFKMGQE